MTADAGEGGREAASGTDLPVTVRALEGTLFVSSKELVEQCCLTVPQRDIPEKRSEIWKGSGGSAYPSPARDAA